MPLQSRLFYSLIKRQLRRLNVSGFSNLVYFSLQQDKNLADIVGRLKEHFNPTKIYLFGSRAKDAAKESSDYDLFLIVKTSEKSSVERMKEAYRVLQGRTVPVDVFVYTEEEFGEYKDEVNSIANTVLTEGVEL